MGWHVQGSVCDCKQSKELDEELAIRQSKRGRNSLAVLNLVWARKVS